MRSTPAGTSPQEATARVPHDAARLDSTEAGQDREGRRDPDRDNQQGRNRRPGAAAPCQGKNEGESRTGRSNPDNTDAPISRGLLLIKGSEQGPGLKDLSHTRASARPGPADEDAPEGS